MNRLLLIDRLSGKRASRYYREYASTQWYDRARLDAYRVAKLRELLVHCNRHVPFYRDALRAAGINPNHVDSLDVLNRLPVVDKAVVKSAYTRLLSTDMRGLGKIRYSQTGGTTGEPLRVPKDVAMRSSALAALERFHDWMSITLGDPVIVLWGAAVVRRPWTVRLREAVLATVRNERRVSTFGISRAHLAEIAHILRTFRPALLHGYCQSIFELAQWFVESGESFELRAVSTTVEPLFAEYRPTLRQAFKCEAFDQYGCGEVEAIAMECGSHEGLHVIEERVVLELDSDGGVIVTDLDNFVFPFIRYRNGDRAVPANRPCRCGRPHQLLDRILGRTGDVIGGPTGKRVHPEFFTHLVNETGVANRRRLRKYQVVQEASDRLRWKLAADALNDYDRQQLVEGVRAYLGPVQVVLEEVDDIPPASSGKFQYVIAHV
ncbi:MAG TPA: hypothetical protein VGQ06_10790 [Gemmatimonadales bacterium]|nr:hypothetical protein [Gemmatimonadales bacterium]